MSKPQSETLALLCAGEEAKELYNSLREVVKQTHNILANSPQTVGNYAEGLARILAWCETSLLSEQAMQTLALERAKYNATHKANMRTRLYRLRKGGKAPRGAKAGTMDLYSGTDPSASLPPGQELPSDTPALSFEDSLAQAEAAKLDATRQAIAEELAKNSFDF